MRNVVVTGGTRGLGLGMSRQLAAEGWRVIAVGRRNSDDLTAAAEACTRTGQGAIDFRAFDLTDSKAIPGFVRELRKDFGAILGLVNNAGLGTSGVLGAMRDSDIQKLVHLNTVAPILLTKYMVRKMMADGAGRIVNVSSIISSTGYSGLSVYAATKASMVGFTRSLAREVGTFGITVNAIAPGFVDTEMTDGLTGKDRDRVVRRAALKRLAEVSDVANGVAFLLSDKAKNITGTVLTVDAGSTA